MGKCPWRSDGKRRGTHLVLIRYCAKLIDSGVPAIATVRSFEPSSVFEILIVAPDSCLATEIGRSVADAVSRSAQPLPDLVNFGTAFADDATDEVVRDGHLGGGGGGGQRSAGGPGLTNGTHCVAGQTDHGCGKRRRQAVRAVGAAHATTTTRGGSGTLRKGAGGDRVVPGQQRRMLKGELVQLCQLQNKGRGDIDRRVRHKRHTTTTTSKIAQRQQERTR